jgi:hypothetical protein
MSIEYPVKNTFIEYQCQRSVSLEMFMKERETQSEPGSLLSRLKSLESSLSEDFPKLDPSEKDSDPAKIEYLVKNTFIDGLADYPAMRSRSLEEFLLERRTNSCPNSGIMQRLESLEEEPCAVPDTLPEFSTKTPSPRSPHAAQVERLESLEEEEGEYESPPEDMPVMFRFPVSTIGSIGFPIMPGAALQGFAQHQENESSAMSMGVGCSGMPRAADDSSAMPLGSFSHVRPDSAGSTMPGTANDSSAMPTGNFSHVRAYSAGSTIVPGDANPTNYDFAQFSMEQPDCQFPMDHQENLQERTVVVELEQVLGNWSLGSSEHHFGRCKPCAFFWKDGCKDGQACQFCHSCPSDEKKKRTKEKLAWRRTAKAARMSLRYGLF